MKFIRKRWLANRRAQLRTKPPPPISLSRPDDEPAVDDSSVCFAAALTFVSQIGGKEVAIELHGPDGLKLRCFLYGVTKAWRACSSFS